MVSLWHLCGGLCGDSGSLWHCDMSVGFLWHSVVSLLGLCVFLWGPQPLGSGMVRRELGSPSFLNA